MRLGKRERAALRAKQAARLVAKKRDEWAHLGHNVPSQLGTFAPNNHTSVSRDWSMATKRGTGETLKTTAQTLEPSYVPHYNADMVKAGYRRGYQIGFKAPAPTLQQRAKAKAFTKASRRIRIKGIDS